MAMARPVHPGEILREEFLAPLELSVRALATALKMEAPRINAVLRERRGITSDLAAQLARYFDTTPQFWMNLQASYDAQVTRRTFKGGPAKSGLQQHSA